MKAHAKENEEKSKDFWDVCHEIQEILSDDDERKGRSVEERMKQFFKDISETLPE